MLVRIRRLRGPRLRCNTRQRSLDRGCAQEVRQGAYSSFAAPAGRVQDAISKFSLGKAILADPVRLLCCRR